MSRDVPWRCSRSESSSVCASESGVGATRKKQQHRAAPVAVGILSLHSRCALARSLDTLKSQDASSWDEWRMLSTRDVTSLTIVLASRAEVHRDCRLF